MEAVDRARLAEIRAWLSPGVLEVPPQWADKLAFLLRLLDERDATLTAYGTRIYRADDGVLIRCESCADARHRYEIDHKDLCIVMYREKDEAVNAARAAALEAPAMIAAGARHFDDTGVECPVAVDIENAIRALANADNQH